MEPDPTKPTAEDLAAIRNAESLRGQTADIPLSVPGVPAGDQDLRGPTVDRAFGALRMTVPKA